MHHMLCGRLGKGGFRFLIRQGRPCLYKHIESLVIENSSYFVLIYVIYQGLYLRVEQRLPVLSSPKDAFARLGGLTMEFRDYKFF